LKTQPEQLFDSLQLDIALPDGTRSHQEVEEDENDLGGSVKANFFLADDA
jgi:hypothetical protein